MKLFSIGLILWVWGGFANLGHASTFNCSLDEFEDKDASNQDKTLEQHACQDVLDSGKGIVPILGRWTIDEGPDRGATLEIQLLIFFSDEGLHKVGRMIVSNYSSNWEKFLKKATFLHDKKNQSYIFELNFDGKKLTPKLSVFRRKFFDSSNKVYNSGGRTYEIVYSNGARRRFTTDRNEQKFFSRMHETGNFTLTYHHTGGLRLSVSHSLLKFKWPTDVPYQHPEKPWFRGTPNLGKTDKIAPKVLTTDSMKWESMLSRI